MNIQMLESLEYAEKVANGEISDIDMELESAGLIDAYESAAIKAETGAVLLDIENLATVFAIRESNLTNVSVESLYSKFGISNEAIDFKDIFERMLNVIIDWFYRLLGIKKIETNVAKSLLGQVKSYLAKLDSLTWTENTPKMDLTALLIFEAMKYNTLTAVTRGKEGMTFILDEALSGFVTQEVMDQMMEATKTHFKGYDGFKQLVMQLGTKTKTIYDKDVIRSWFTVEKDDYVEFHLNKDIEQAISLLKWFDGYIAKPLKDDGKNAAPPEVEAKQFLTFLEVFCHELNTNRNSEAYDRAIKVFKEVKKEKFEHNGDKELKKRINIARKNIAYLIKYMKTVSHSNQVFLRSLTSIANKGFKYIDKYTKSK